MEAYRSHVRVQGPGDRSGLACWHGERPSPRRGRPGLSGALEARCFTERLRYRAYEPP